MLAIYPVAKVNTRLPLPQTRKMTPNPHFSNPCGIFTLLWAGRFVAATVAPESVGKIFARVAGWPLADSYAYDLRGQQAFAVSLLR